MPTDLRFEKLRMINHAGKVIIFGESKGESDDDVDRTGKLWYRVLDLEQSADQDNPNAWDDNTRWTDWMEIPYPQELRDVAMSLLTIRQTVDDKVHDQLKAWRVLSDGDHLYLFRAIDLAASETTDFDVSDPALPPEPTPDPAGDNPLESDLSSIRVYANRFVVRRDISPASGTNRGASGQEITVPQLALKSESRYRRSQMRETPQSDLDGQGFLNMGSELFAEPTMEFGMVAPMDGLFTVALAPSSVPQRSRWQFFWKASEGKIAALSMLRDQGGWVDFEEEKYNQFNAAENPFRLVPDQIFTLDYAQGGDNVNRVPLDLVGQPDAILYRSQEEAGGTEGEKIQALSGERVLLAARVNSGAAENIVVVDFGLDDKGVADIPENVEVDDVNFARTALHLNSETDAIILPEGVPDFNGSFTFGAWVKHNEGEGTLVRRGLNESIATSTGFAIEWKPLEGKLIAYVGSAENPVEIAAALPTSHTWHHIGLVVVGENVSLYIDGIKVSTAVGIAGFTAAGQTFIGGASGEAREGNWLDFEIDQIVLWGDGRAPSKSPKHITKYGIYSELSAAELADPALLGAWTMDDSHDGSATETADSSPHGNTAMIYGADHVNQTAPIFKTDGGNFEDRLTGMSVGMGLISIKDKSLIDDPTLFLSSDGLVHLYSSAAPGSRAENELAVLQYDTTSTRTQFGVQWQAAVEVGGQEVKESGELLLTAKTPGPIMNRTIVELKNRKDAIKLKIYNPATGLVEIWKKLPSDATALAIILNGQANPDRPQDPKEWEENTVYYDYGANATYYRKKLPGTAEDGQEKVAVSSPTFTAGAVAAPQNGSKPIIAPHKVNLVQQGNFGGWVHAPVAVSGRFGPREGLQPAAAVVDLANDDLMQLCCPGDFALEAWVNPDDLPVADVVNGGIEESRVVSLRGELETARYTMGLRSAMSLKLDKTKSRNLAKDTPIFNPHIGMNESFTITVRFNTPEEPDQVGSLFQLYHDDKNMFYVEVDNNGVWFKVRSSISQPNQHNGVYASFRGGRGESVQVAFVWDIVTQNVGEEGDSVFMKKNADGFMRIYMDGQQVDYEKVKAMVQIPTTPEEFAAITQINSKGYSLNINKPFIPAPNEGGTSTGSDKYSGYSSGSGSTSGNVKYGENFYDGCGLAMQDFRIYEEALNQSDLIILPLKSTIHWDFSIIKKTMNFKGNVGFKVVNQGTRDSKWDFTIDESQIETGHQLYAATGARQALSNVQIPTQKWSHIAAVCSGNHALSFTHDLKQRVIVKDGNGLNARTSFTIDCTVRWNGSGNKWSGSRGKQYIFSRSSADGSDVIFQMGLNNGRPFIEFGMTNANGEKERPLQYAGFRLKKNKSYYLVARCELSTETIEFYNDEGETTASFELWLLDKDIWAYDLDDEEWVNGLIPEIVELTEAQKEATIGFTNLFNLLPLMMDRMYHISEKNRFNTKIGLLQSDLMASIGSLSAEGDTADIREQGWFDGDIGQLRFWTRALSEIELKRLALHAGVPSGVTPPTANWRFEENRGLLANDASGGLTATLSDENMWITSRMTSRLSLYVNGRLATSRFGGDGSSVDYGDREQLTFGALPSGKEKDFRAPMRGQIDDIRIWGDLRSQEDIYDNRHVLLGGNETDLAGFWPISTGNGFIIKDVTVFRNHAVLNFSTDEEIETFWESSTAPLGNDLPQVRNILDGPITTYIAGPATSNSAAEYGDFQTDAEGLNKAVMKRVLAALAADGRCLTFTGFKVGDLDLTYIGQAQSDPTLIGYIEGPPPVPSENATRPYYTSPYAYTNYYNSASVQLTEAENTVQVYSGESTRGSDFSLDTTIGLTGAEFDAKTGWAFGPFFGTKVFGFTFMVTGQMAYEQKKDVMGRAGAEIGTQRTLTNKIETVGNWENPADILNNDVGRRYEFSNIGYALVKSGVANIYTMQMRKTGTLMGVTMIPDPDIKEDFNIIMFEIEPTYTKQGTLDGKIGFENDRDWPAANQKRGSYFKPKEVNNLVKQIEANEADLAARYSDFNPISLGQQRQSWDKSRRDPLNDVRSRIDDESDSAYNWAKQFSKRNIVNTYVWTADSGFFAEENQTAVVREESLGGSYSMKFMGGVGVDFKFTTPGLGIKFDIKSLFGRHIETKYVKTKKEGRNFGLNVNLNADGLLRKYQGNDDPDHLYGDTDVPGKVTGYRFKTFYLTPDKSHFRTFFNKVVSPKWLQSDHPNAVALRAARGNLNHVWRVMHRVTYVSRVPPGGNKPATSSEKPTRAVIHKTPNRAIINLVLDTIRERTTSTGEALPGSNAQDPKRIAAAVADVIDHQLAISIPWWQGYLDRARAEPGSARFNELKRLKQAVYEYMLAYFVTGDGQEDERLKNPPEGSAKGNGDGD